jgi:hypothetical protein
MSSYKFDELRAKAQSMMKDQNLPHTVPVKGFLDTRLLLKNSIMPPFSRLLRSSRVVAGPVA